MAEPDTTNFACVCRLVLTSRTRRDHDLVACYERVVAQRDAAEQDMRVLHDDYQVLRQAYAAIRGADPPAVLTAETRRADAAETLAEYWEQRAGALAGAVADVLWVLQHDELRAAEAYAQLHGFTYSPAFLANASRRREAARALLAPGPAAEMGE